MLVICVGVAAAAYSVVVACASSGAHVGLHPVALTGS